MMKSTANICDVMDTESALFVIGRIVGYPGAWQFSADEEFLKFCASTEACKQQNQRQQSSRLHLIF
jgi:hypothetical protein